MKATDRWEDSNTADLRTFLASPTGQLLAEVLQEFAASKTLYAVHTAKSDRDYHCGNACGCNEMLETISNHADLAQLGTSPSPTSQQTPEGVTSAEQLYAP